MKRSSVAQDVLLTLWVQLILPPQPFCVTGSIDEYCTKLDVSSRQGWVIDISSVHGNGPRYSLQ